MKNINSNKLSEMSNKLNDIINDYNTLKKPIKKTESCFLFACHYLNITKKLIDNMIEIEQEKKQFKNTYRKVINSFKKSIDKTILISGITGDKEYKYTFDKEYNIVEDDVLPMFTICLHPKGKSDYIPIKVLIDENFKILEPNKFSFDRYTITL